jgi:CcmD family protein
VAAAYAFVWVALFGYVWSLGSRLGKAETDLARLERKDH